MFLKEFSDKEKGAFLSLCREFIELSDNKELSNSFLDQFKAEMNLDSSFVTPNLSFEEASSEFESKKHRLQVLLELVGFAHIDSNYSTLESEFIKKLASCFSIDESKLIELENWVIRLNSLINEANHFWEE